MYEYKDEKFSVNVDKENDCALKVSKDGFTATVSVLEKAGKFRVSANDGLIATLENGEDSALNQACERVLQQHRATSKKELCDRLENLYEKVDG